MQADRIIVLDAGRISATGTRDDLVKAAGPYGLAVASRDESARADAGVTRTRITRERVL